MQHTLEKTLISGELQLSYAAWIGFWIQDKIYRKILEWIIKGSKHSIGYLSTVLWNNPSSCKEEKLLLCQAAMACF